MLAFLFPVRFGGFDFSDYPRVFGMLKCLVLEDDRAHRYL